MKKGSRKRILAMLMSLCVVFGTLSVPKVALAASVDVSNVQYTHDGEKWVYNAEDGAEYTGDLQIEADHIFNITDVSCTVNSINSITVKSDGELNVFGSGKLTCGTIGGEPGARIMLGDGSSSIVSTTNFYSPAGEELTGDWTGFRMFVYQMERQEAQSGTLPAGWYEEQPPVGPNEFQVEVVFDNEPKGGSVHNGAVTFSYEGVAGTETVDLLNPGDLTTGITVVRTDTDGDHPKLMYRISVAMENFKEVQNEPDLNSFKMTFTPNSDYQIYAQFEDGGDGHRRKELAGVPSTSPYDIKSDDGDFNGWRFVVCFEEKGTTHNNNNDNNNSVNVPIGYLGLHDVNGGNFFYENDQQKEWYGYIEYCTQDIDGTVQGTVPIPNPDDPANDRFNWDDIDWTQYTWKPYEPADGAIWADSADPVSTAYKLPDDVKMVRVYSLSNYWCMMRGVNQNGYRGVSYHAILLDDGTIKNDKDCTPEEFENGTKITSNIFVINGSDGYLVEFSPHNILWYNDEATAKERGGEDALVTGGRVEFVSCAFPDSSDPYDGLVGSYETDAEDKPIVEFLDDNGRVLGGGCAALEGAVLTLRFIPDYGYQFKEAMINGRPVVPQDDNYTFEFQFPQGTYHLNVEFVPGEDKASGSAEGVGTVEAVSGTEGDESIVGNLMIDGDEADLTAAEEAAMAAALEADSSIDMSIIEDAYIDLTLQSYAEKGDTDEYWSETLTETDEDVMVSINVTDSVAARIEAADGECSVVRAHGSGSDVSYTVLPATYDPAEKIITFASNQFSTFAIATGDEPECPHAETEIKNAKEATCKEKGYTGDKVCKSCGEVVEEGSEIAATGKHTYDEGKVTTEPTTGTEGVKTYTCTVCGDTKTEKIPAKTGEWKEDSTGWWYQRTDGSYPAGAWEQIDGEWYLFDAAGYMLTGWQQVGGKWYYLKSDGAMAYSTVIDGYTLDASGAWVDYGWKQDANGWWYKHADGSYPASAWELIDGEWYLFDASGYMLTGWQKVGGIWYYLYTSGAMAKDTTIDGYVIGASGAMVENGWRQDSTGWWYLNSDGSFPAACWKLIDAVWYRFNTAGYMQTGWIDDGGTWYYAESNGTLATGWKQIGSTWYYFFRGGAMAVDTEVDGYKINSDGAWVE